jgi:hypothetical protein
MDRVSFWLAAGVEWLHGYGLDAPLVQFVLAALLGFLFVERWQRWRQRRDFQYRTLVKFGELSYEMTDRLSELLMKRSQMRPDLYEEKRREMIARWATFVSMRGEVMACYGLAFLQKEEYQGMFHALNALRGYARAPEAVPMARFEPEQEKYLAYQEAIVADMVHAMGLVSWRQRRAEKRYASARVQRARAALGD